MGLMQKHAEGLGKRVRCTCADKPSHRPLRKTLVFSIYTLSDLGVLSNLIGSLSLANEPTE